MHHPSSEVALERLQGISYEVIPLGGWEGWNLTCELSRVASQDFVDQGSLIDFDGLVTTALPLKDDGSNVSEMKREGMVMPDVPVLL